MKIEPSYKLNDLGPPSPAAHSGFLVDLSSLSFSEGGGPITSWIQALPFGTYHHPIYGEIKVDTERVTRLANNVKNNVRGQDLDIDYDHKGDPVQGNKAAGWVVDAEARSNGLWLLVEWTKSAVEAIRNREWRYFSPEFVDDWKHPKTGEEFKDVLFGGGLTNRPFLKDILPINLSEMLDQQGQQEHKEGEQVDRAQICKLLGLKEDASDEVIQAKLTELTQTTSQLSELLEGDDLVAAVKQLKEPDDPTNEETLLDQIKKLGEDNPVVQKLTEQVQSLVEQNKSLTDKVVDLTGKSREAAIEKKLSEIESGGRQLTPVQRGEFKNILMNSPEATHESVYKLAAGVAKKSGVELSERGGTRGPGEGREEESATKRFNDRVATIMKDSDGNIAFGDAVEMVSREEPQLFAEYRRESYNREEV